MLWKKYIPGIVKNRTPKKNKQRNFTNQKPCISVIIPVYEVEPYLRECLDSVVNQTLSNIEIICIDDASRDNCFSILSEYAKADDRFVIYQNVTNMKAGYCRNFCLRKAKGKYVFFLDSDDFIKAETLENLYRKIEETKADICQYLAYVYNNVTKIAAVSAPNVFETVRNLDSKTYNYKCDPKLMFNRVEAWAKLYRKKFLLNNKIKFFENTFFEDTFAHIKSVSLAERICFDDNAYIYYRRNREGQITGNSADTDKFLDVFNYINKAETFFKKQKMWDEIKNYYYDFAVRRMCNYYVRCNEMTKKKFAKRAMAWAKKKQMEEIKTASEEKFEDFCKIIQYGKE